MTRVAAEPVEAFISVGSNIHPETNVPAALERLARQVELIGVSTFYWAEAMDRPDDSDYLNGVAAIRTVATPRALKYGILHPIEESLGRLHLDDQLGPRTIDLNLVLYGSLALDEPGLRLPSDDIVRPFVAGPLIELAGDRKLPGCGCMLSALCGAAVRRALRPAGALSDQLKARFCR
jgi:2-amino-4-hydroxy-6-hydroxymethyldihydropteridine diphosphokinase